MATGRNRFFRQRVVLLGAILGVLASFPLASKPLTVSADVSGCVHNSNGTYGACRYTQLENNAYPQYSSDPDCHQYCAWYLHGSGSQNYPYADLINVMSYPGVDFHKWMNSAVYAWSGLPYSQPIFYNCGCSSGQFLTVGNLQRNNPDGSVNTTACGFGDVTTAWEAGGQSGDNHVTSSYADYNDQYSSQWADTDNPPNSGKYCSASQTAYHEVGHAFGEGHSTADPSEIMYTNPSNYTGGANFGTVDDDAQQLMADLYGAYDNTSNSNNPSNCRGCQMACPQISEGVAADGITTINSALWTVCGTSYTLPDVWGYYAKLWDMYQGSAWVPSVSVPYVISLVSPASCNSFFDSHQLVLWLECVAPLK